MIKDFLKKYYMYIVVILIAIIGIIPTYFSKDNVDIPEIQVQTVTEPVQIKHIYVDIKGNVLNPGVYKLEEGTRLFQLVELSGGLDVDSDTSLINLSSILTDQQVIYIPKVGEIIPDEYTELIDDNTTDKDDKININTAEKNELTELPGIGEVTAQSIIDYRNENGDFKTIEDIMNVVGIGESTFENIKDFITI